MAALNDAFVNPELLGWHRSAEALLIVLLGGIGALHGPILGAFAYTLIGELGQQHHRAAAPGGRSRHPRRGAAAAPWPGRIAAALPHDRRCCRRPALSRRFGGLLAVSDVSLDLAVGELHAVIGPNGAGKSTLVNLLAGELAPTSGSIRIDGRDVTGWSNWRIARCGVGRSFQRTNLMPEMTVLENARLAVPARRSVAHAAAR